MANEIIINRMFSGSYLENDENIGHEIINLYKPDSSDTCYIYLVPSGDYANEHQHTEVDGVLLVRGVHANCLEVIAKATGIQRVFNCEDGKSRDWRRIAKGPEFFELAYEKQIDGSPLHQQQKQKRKNFLEENAYQRRYIENHNIRYGGILADKLFDNNPEARFNLSLFITFASDTIQRVKTPFYLITDESHRIPGQINYIIERKRLAGSAGTTFFSNKENIKLEKVKGETEEAYDARCKEYSKKELNNYTVLSNILNNSELWGEYVEEFDPKKVSEDDTFSFFTITRKEFDELAFSNAFAYFFEKYDTLLEAVTEIAKREYEKDISLSYRVIKTAVEAKKDENDKSTDAKIYREKKNIDILITDDHSKNTIVIENKIKSGIHGERHDLNGEYIQNQLDKYYAYVEKEYPAHKGYKNHYFLFLPDYNQIQTDHFQTEAQKAFKPIYFSQLYEGFTKCLSAHPELSDDVYFCDFLKALKRHSSKIDNNYEEVMKRKMKKLVNDARVNERKP